jgi:ribosomal protein S18 acetylase RimI-like enzyme
MTLGTIAENIENNTVEYFLSLGYAAKDEICDSPKVKYILNNSGHSRIFKARLTDAEAGSMIDHILTRLKEHGLSALWFVTPASRPEFLESRLEERGFRYQKDWISMAFAAGDLLPFTPPQGFTIKEVLSDEELKTWSSILVKSFEIREDLSNAYGGYFADMGIGDGTKRHYYLGYMNGEPVSVASLFNSSGTAGIYYVGTLREYRRKGIGMAMTGHLVGEARKSGHDLITLNASRSGYPLYRKMGFNEYYRTRIYQWP